MLENLVKKNQNNNKRKYLEKKEGRREIWCERGSEVKSKILNTKIMVSRMNAYSRGKVTVKDLRFPNHL